MFVTLTSSVRSQNKNLKETLCLDMIVTIVATIVLPLLDQSCRVLKTGYSGRDGGPHQIIHLFPRISRSSLVMLSCD